MRPGHELAKEFQWLGDYISQQDVLGYTVVKVLHNKISNRKRDEVGFHIVYPNGKVHREYYQNSTMCLLAIACLESGDMKTDAVPYMARAAGIDPNVIATVDMTLDKEGSMPYTLKSEQCAGRKVEVTLKVMD